MISKGVHNFPLSVDTCRQIDRFVLCRQIVDLVQNFYVGSPLGDLNPLSYPRSKKKHDLHLLVKNYASALFLTMLFLLARPRPLVRRGSPPNTNLAIRRQRGDGSGSSLAAAWRRRRQRGSSAVAVSSTMAAALRHRGHGGGSAAAAARRRQRGSGGGSGSAAAVASLAAAASALRQRGVGGGGSAA